uniref:glycosyltransferase family 2 protein n=1 Tax=Bacteroides cellulosilyticus TaxID=246787 RepID=UPI004027535B
MKWYSKYLEVFEHSSKEIPNTIKDRIANQIRTVMPKEAPLCSVIAIAHNEETHILGCLWSLADNICDFPFEIIVVNNHSTDATEQLLKEVGVTYYNEEKQSPGFARQCGLNHAYGKYHICIDADTLYPPHYIATHLKYLEQPGIVCTYGLWSFLPDEKYTKTGLFFYESLRDLYLLLQNIKRPELVVRGMVLAFHTESARKVGFRTDVIRGEDGKMALGLKQYGKLKFIKSHKVRAVTNNSILNNKGRLINNIWFRIKKGVKNFKLLLTTKTE